MAKAKERQTGGKPKPSRDTTVTRLKDLGISHNQSSKWQNLADAPGKRLEQAPGQHSRRIVRDVYAFTRGKPMQWVPVETIARRLSLSDEAMTAQAIELARRKSWLDFAGGHSICLTEEGRRMAR